MPGYAYGLPAQRCITGSRLAKIPGTICSDCYALKGMYQFPVVKEAQERRYKSLKHKHWVDAMIFLMKKKKNLRWFRWHDSGDLQSEEHLENIIKVANACPETNFWLPTREKQIVDSVLKRSECPANLVIRMSGTMIDGHEPIRFVNTSTVVSSSAEATCPAYKQGGKCGNCRACWDPRVRNVAYPQH
jgi:hypothetical protein